MKKTSLVIFFFISLNVFAQPLNFNGSLSSAFDNKVNEIFSANAGIRYLDDYGTSFLGGSVSFLDNFALGFEYSNQFRSTQNELLFFSLRYALNENITIGSFITGETKRYGLFGSYEGKLDDLSYLISAGLDFYQANYFVSLKNPIELNNQMFIANEVIVSEGRIQSHDNIELLLISTGLGYGLTNNIVIQGNMGINLLAGPEELNYQATIGYNL